MTTARVGACVVLTSAQVKHAYSMDEYDVAMGRRAA